MKFEARGNNVVKRIAPVSCLLNGVSIFLFFCFVPASAFVAIVAQDNQRSAVQDANAQKFGLALKLDHFWFYKVTPVETKASVSVKGQFDKDSVAINLSSIDFFANPVRKDKGKLINPMAHLTWYKSKQQLKEPKRAVEFENQFGRQEMLLGDPIALLVPTERVEKGSTMPDGLDHYKVYKVLEAKRIKRTVALEDSFGFQNGVTIGRSMYFAVPVTMKHGKTAFKINKEKAHLTLYEAPSPKKHDKKQETLDPFGKHILIVNANTMLALPTVKIAWIALRSRQ